MQPPTQGKFAKKKADIAQLVEHDLAKVGVASSSLVFRSKKRPEAFSGFFAKKSEVFKRITKTALVVELVDTQDLKSCDR